MKTTHKISSALLLTTLFGVTACAGTDVQGRIQPTPPVSTPPELSVEVSAQSPRGSRSVSASDTFLVVDLTANASDVLLPDGTKFLVRFRSSTNDLDPAADGVAIVMDETGSPLGTGTLDVISSRDGRASITLTGAPGGLTIPSGSTLTLAFTGDSGAFINEEPGEDDLFIAGLAFNLDRQYTVLGPEIAY